ncbi:MAG: hypothetical protein M3072_16000 [Candidatus Dormibacteraeota bacterium]|nr:hypothetical protein [Candidatus Dormibacteraeota bacterium]
MQLTIARLGSAEQGERLLAPIRAAAPAILDYAGEMPFAAVDSMSIASGYMARHPGTTFESLALLSTHGIVTGSGYQQ